MLQRSTFLLGLLINVASPVEAAAPAAATHSPEETALLAADARQRDAVASVDLKAIGEIAHPNLRVNAPNNRILTRDDLIRMFERTPETATVTGDVGIVMGRELVFPGAASEQARMYGRKTLNRRYTNVYLREAGVWRHIARHANIIP